VVKIKVQVSGDEVPGLKVGPSIRYQHGTSFASGGMALVGERGPEIAFIPRGAQVMPADQSRHYTENYNLTVNSQQQSAGVAREFDLMRSLASR
jgi:phage-related tail protein